MTPDDFIARINELFPQGYEEMTGGCVKFGALLKAVFGGECFYNGDHLITRIDGKHFDIDGEVKDVTEYMPTSEFRENFKRWKTARINEV